MKRSDGPANDWQQEVWRIKEELSVEATRMGLREYLAFAEREAERVLRARTGPEPALARDRPATSTGQDHGT